MESMNEENQIGNILDTCTQVRVFLFEKQAGRGSGYKIYLFPNNTTLDIIEDYKSNFKLFVSNRDIVDYSQTETKKETIQKLSCAELPQWNEFQQLIDSLPITNTPIFTAGNISDKIKMVVVECRNENDEEPIYLISKFSYKTVYGRKIRFSISGGTFKKIPSAVLTLGDCIDCFIYADNVYILLESRFDSLFDFHKRIKDAVNSNLHLASNWDFFDRNDIASAIIGKPRKGRQFLKVLNSNNLDTWKHKTHVERKKIIQGDNKLKDKFQFDDNDRIIFSKESLSELFKLLTDDYFKSIITGETSER